MTRLKSNALSSVSTPSSDQGKREKSRLKGSALSLEPTPCRGIGCKVKFLPIWRDQGFHSPDCKSKYFAFARKLGDALLKAHTVEVNEGEPGNYEVKFNGQILPLKLQLKGREADEENQAPASFGDKKSMGVQAENP